MQAEAAEALAVAWDLGVERTPPWKPEASPSAPRAPPPPTPAALLFHLRESFLFLESFVLSTPKSRKDCSRSFTLGSAGGGSRSSAASSVISKLRLRACSACRETGALGDGPGEVSPRPASRGRAREEKSESGRRSERRERERERESERAAQQELTVFVQTPEVYLSRP